MNGLFWAIRIKCRKNCGIFYGAVAFSNFFFFWFSWVGYSEFCCCTLFLFCFYLPSFSYFFFLVVCHLHFFRLIYNINFFFFSSNCNKELFFFIVLKVTQKTTTKGLCKRKLVFNDNGQQQWHTAKRKYFSYLVLMLFLRFFLHVFSNFSQTSLIFEKRGWE